MIEILNIRKVESGKYDEVWAIVRSLKMQKPWLKQVSELSPSWSLFSKYMRLKSEGKWNAETFKSVYVPQFLSEIAASQAARTALNKLWEADKAGKNIALVCFCEEEELCHRSIVAGLLQRAGANVKTETGRNYSEYALSATRGHQSSTASGCAVASQPLTTVAARASEESVSSQNVNLIPKGETKMFKVEKVLEAFADEKRLHKMVDISYDPKIQVRPMFDAGNISEEPLEEFASMSLTFFAGQTMFIVEVWRDIDENEFGSLKEFSGTKGNWHFESENDLSDEVAHNLCAFADLCVSHDQYIVRETAEKASMYEPDVWESDKYLEREYWDEERGEYRSRLTDEVEFRDPRYYTKREDDGCYGRYDSYYARPCLSALGF